MVLIISHNFIVSPDLKKASPCSFLFYLYKLSWNRAIVRAHFTHERNESEKVFHSGEITEVQFQTKRKKKKRWTGLNNDTVQNKKYNSSLFYSTCILEKSMCIKNH